MFSYLQYTRLLLSLYDFFIEQIIDKFQIAKYFWNKSLYLDIFISILNVGRKWQRCLRSLDSSVCVVPLSYLVFFGIFGIYYRNEIYNLNDTKWVT